jgi:hypothetical protein
VRWEVRARRVFVACARALSCVVRERVLAFSGFVISRVLARIGSNDPHVIHFPNDFNVFRVCVGGEAGAQGISGEAILGIVGVRVRAVVGQVAS